MSWDRSQSSTQNTIRSWKIWLRILKPSLLIPTKTGERKTEMIGHLLKLKWFSLSIDLFTFSINSYRPMMNGYEWRINHSEEDTEKRLDNNWFVLFIKYGDQLKDKKTRLCIDWWLYAMEKPEPMVRYHRMGYWKSRAKHLFSRIPEYDFVLW